MQIYIHRNNEQLGPFTEAEIKAQLASGAVSLQDHVWWQGQEGWVQLGQSSLLTPGFTPPPATTTVPAANATGLETSKLAIWALVCGCLSLICNLLTAIPAIILGHMGLAETKKNPAIQGRGMAMAGMILGYVILALTIAYFILIFVVFASMGSQVKDVFKTINTQLNAAQASNSAVQFVTPPNQATNAPAQTAPTPAATNSPDQSTNSAPVTTNAPDQSTNSAPAATNSPDSSTNSSTPSTNASASSTNAAPVSQ